MSNLLVEFPLYLIGHWQDFLGLSGELQLGNVAGTD
jgi:hypothetical protein